MRLLKQSSTAQVLMFLMLDAIDHITGKTGLSPTVTLSKNGGAFGGQAGTVTELANGWYKVAGNATDTATLGPLILHATGTGADPVDVEFTVVAFDPQDAVRMGLTAMPNAVAGASGGLVVIGTGTNTFKSDSSANVTTGALGANAITSSGIAADAFAAAAFAASSLDGKGNWSTGLNTSDIQDQLADVEDQLDNVQARLPAALDDGKIVATVGASQAGIFPANFDELIITDGRVTVGQNFDKTGYALSAAQTFNLTGNITGNLTGSVGSVTGAVGSVAGNVGGNVAGSVASVTGNVGGSVASVVGNVGGSVASIATGGIVAASYASGAAPLMPTVAGRTLDVSVTGEAGIDWANIGSPTTGVNLSGTTIGLTAGGTVTVSAQTIRDAMTLAPTLAIAGGSIDGLLNALQGGRIVARSTVLANGFMVIVRGKAYTTTTTTYPQWVDTVGQWPTLTGGTVTLSFRLKDEEGEVDDAAAPDLTITGAIITGSGSNKTVRAYLSAAQSGSLTVGERNHRFYVDAILSNGEPTELVRGDATVFEEGA